MKRRIDLHVSRVRKLFASTLAGGHEDHAAWNAVSALRRGGSKFIFEQAKLWCISRSARKRDRGAAVLAQLRYGTSYRPFRSGQPVFRKESLAVVMRMLEAETDLEAIGSEIAALGHLEQPSAVPLIASFATHPDNNIRFDVACALGHFPDDETAVSALQVLMEDTDKDVRNWAIFGVGVLGNTDNNEIRDALFKHLDDPFFDAKLEATCALAKRHDSRVVKPLIQSFRAYGDIYSLCEAAEHLLNMENKPEPTWTANQYIEALESACTVTP